MIRLGGSGYEQAYVEQTRAGLVTPWHHYNVSIICCAVACGKSNVCGMCDAPSIAVTSL